jgi:hypothetical protein
MKNLGEIFYVISIEIHKDKSQKTLTISKGRYWIYFFEKSRMSNCTFLLAFIVKINESNKNQYLQNTLKI